VPVLSHQDISDETPLRLNRAAELGFPDGSMTEAGLRNEAAKGRLTVERVAGKTYTTLGDIKRMRQLCRVEARVPGSNLEQNAEMGPAKSHITPNGGSGTASETLAQAALNRTLLALSESFASTSRQNTPLNGKSKTSSKSKSRTF